MATALLAPILGSIAGLFGNKGGGTQEGSSTSSGTTTSGVNLKSPYQDFINRILGQYTQMMNSPTDTAGYAATQEQGINKTSAASGQAVNNIMAARGLSMSPVAATAEANNEANRFSQISQMKQSLPLLDLQTMLQKLSGAGGFSSTLAGLSPTTSSTQQTGQTTGSTASNDGGWGNALGTGLSTWLAMNYPQKKP